jgi:hypothetical protein
MNTPKEIKPELLTEKVIDTKGINTVSGNDDQSKDEGGVKDILQGSLNKPFPEALEYKEPKNASEAFMAGAGTRAGSSISSSVVNSSGLIDTKALNEIYASVNLAEGLPDANEREKFKAYHGDKIVNLFNEDDIGVRFERDLEDLAIYKSIMVYCSSTKSCKVYRVYCISNNWYFTYNIWSR